VALLLLEPDFGGGLVLAVTLGSMLFVAGAKLWQCLLLLSSAGGALFVLAVFVPYRFKRLESFLDPWKDQFDSGYQLTQSLIAFGRGEWFGLGLGNSIQKLLYLPEAHTDFIFAIYAEEFGFAGVLLLLSLFIALLVKIFVISRKALICNDAFIGLTVFGVGVLFTVQVLINMGVTSGFMPTKGLTLPLVSYGGSSLLASCLLIALVLRMDYDLKSTTTHSTTTDSITTHSTKG
jgi:cell division protein FtsW